jgi:hypothetical protein
MERETQRLITSALAVLALAGCQTNDKDADTGGDGPRFSGDYSDCDPDEVDSLPEARWPVVIEEQANGADYVQPTGVSMPELDAEEDLLVCMDLDGADIECATDPEDDPVWRDAWSMVVHDVTEELGEPEEGYSWELYQYCGPMMLDGACCWTVGLEALEDPDDSGDDEGRPFLVQGERRTACTIPGGGWCEALAPRPASADNVPALVARWTGAGRAEHASVAAFSRFGLVLMHHGAPAELVRAAHRAALDEVRHGSRPRAWCMSASP